MNKKIKKGKKLCLNKNCKIFLPINQNICPKCNFFNKKDNYENKKDINEIINNSKNEKLNKKNIKEIKYQIKKNLFTDDIYKLNNKKTKEINSKIKIKKSKTLILKNLKQVIKNEENVYYFSNNISFIKIINFDNYYFNLVATFNGYSNNTTLKAFEIEDIYLLDNEKVKGYLSINLNENKNFNSVYEFDNKISFIDLILKIEYNFIIGIIFNDCSLSLFSIKFEKNNIKFDFLFNIKENFKITKFKKIILNEMIYLLVTTSSGSVFIIEIDLEKLNYSIKKEFNKNNNFYISSIDTLNDENFVISTLDGIVYIYNIYDKFPLFEYHSFNKPINNLIWDISGNFIFFNDEFENNCISCFYFTENNKIDKNKTFKKNFKLVSNIIKMFSKKDKIIITTKDSNVYVIDKNNLRNNIIKPKIKDILKCKIYFLNKNNKIETGDKIDMNLIKKDNNNNVKNQIELINNFKEIDDNKIKNCDYINIDKKEILIISKNKVLIFIENNLN